MTIREWVDAINVRDKSMNDPNYSLARTCSSIKCNECPFLDNGCRSGPRGTNWMSESRRLWTDNDARRKLDLI